MTNLQETAINLLEERGKEIAQLRKERESFYSDYRMKCDAETKVLYEQREEDHKLIEKMAYALRASERQNAPGQYIFTMEALAAFQEWKEK